MNDNGLYVDKVLGRHSSLASFALAAGTSTPVAAASAKRVCITFGSDGGAIINLGQQDPVDGLRSIRIPVASVPIVLDIATYGSLIQGNWFATIGAGSAAIYVIDTVEQ